MGPALQREPFMVGEQLEAALSAIPGLLDVKLQQLRCPSASVLVVQAGRVIFSSFRGSARWNSTAPLSDTTGYEIASVSKTFTTAMLFKLRDEGKLEQGLDTAVSALLPGFTTKSPYASTRPLTLRALALHASGLPREIPSCFRCSQAEILSLVAELTPLCEQFGGTHYSNLGIALLGRALEMAAGKSWERFVVEDLMLPLGMVNSGPAPADNVHMADGVDPDTGTLVPPSANSTWGAPCGGLHSTPRDMATWMNFLMDAHAGSAQTRAAFASVLDPATRAEMRSSGFFQGDGISAVGSGTFEMAYSAQRWTANKLGCTDGYRSAITMVPSLSLGVFGVATSTCDLYGDGDAVSFPVVSKIIPLVEQALLQRSQRNNTTSEGAHSRAVEPNGSWPYPSSFMPPADVLANVSGQYCNQDAASPDGVVVRVESVDGLAGGASVLVMRPSLKSSQGYPYVLQWIGHESGAPATGPMWFRMVMGPEKYLPSTWPGCSTSTANGTALNLCPISCMRKLARGSGQLVNFQWDRSSNKMLMKSQSGERCHKWRSPEQRDAEY